MSNSSLAKVIMISPNRTNNRNHVIDTITIHCVVGQCTAKRIGEIFANSSAQASSNYGVGTDGTIGLYVEEKDRSWCTSNSSNDHRAVTIEVASDTVHPYAVNSKAYSALIELVADICKRNNIKKVLWQGNKNLIGQIDKQNMTAHRWFANKACPGDYLYTRFGDIANKVNVKLGVSGDAISTPTTSTTSNTSYIVQITATNLRIRSGPGTNYNVVSVIKPGCYTIVQESTGAGASKWGKLKSGAGWISLDYAKKVS